MGGNGAYIASEGGVPAYKRTHTDTDYRVDGHKVLVQSKNPLQKKCPVNSNSENPIYLCGTTDVVDVNSLSVFIYGAFEHCLLMSRCISKLNPTHILHKLINCGE